jgi:hypothetical protein
MNPLATTRDHPNAFDSGKREPRSQCTTTEERGSAFVEEGLITRLLNGSVTMETACGSTSQIIAACGALGRYEHLPEPYQT